MKENQCTKEAMGKDLKSKQLLAHIPIVRKNDSKKCSKEGNCLQTFVCTSIIR